MGVARHSGSQTLAWQTHFQAVSRDAPLKTANDIIRGREREWNFLLNDIGWLNLLLVACRRLAEETFLQRSFMKMQIPSADTWQLQQRLSLNLSQVPASCRSTGCLPASLLAPLWPELHLLHKPLDNAVELLSPRVACYMHIHISKHFLHTLSFLRSRILYIPNRKVYKT